MAPEVALSKPYSHRAEVFAFGTLVWQMLAHERPFADCDVTTFYQRVCHRGERPKIPRDTPPQLAECVAYARTQPHFPLFHLFATCTHMPLLSHPQNRILLQCWEVEPARRPELSAVLPVLDELLRQHGDYRPTTAPGGTSRSRRASRG